MNLNTFALQTTTITCLSLHTLSSQAKPAAPNLIIILTDDMGYADVGFNGCKDIPTPHIDTIAARGVQFTSGYVAYSYCSPSRAGLLTGRYPQRFGHEYNPPDKPDDPTVGLPRSETTLADSLGKAGYYCGIVGKWHLGMHESLHPMSRGFDEFFGFLGGLSRYLPENHPRIFRNHEPVTITKYLTDEFSDEALRFVEKNKDKPFFLYLAYNAPHIPMQASGKYLARFPNIENPARRTYAAMVSAVDDGVGRLLDKLRELNLEENTLIFFLSDNGGPPAQNASDNAPLRGGKSSVWEGGFRVPFAVQWPEHLPAGIKYDYPVSSLDIFATIAALADAPTDPARPLDGVNLIPYLTGKDDTEPHNAIYTRKVHDGSFAVRNGDYKLVIQGENQNPQLYDLGKDIGETTDLAAQKPEQLQTLDKLRQQWNAQLIEPVFKGQND